MNDIRRCSWVNLNNPTYIEYHDNEWCKPGGDETYLFEMLVLESFQAGLSWECVLNKREAFRKAFDQFDYKIIADYSDEKIQELLSDKGIIRNRLKIKAAILNAKIFMDIQREFGSFAKYIQNFTSGKIIINRDSIIRATSPLSDMVSKDLKKRGMKFVGSTIIYSYLQAIGMIDDHEPQCFCSAQKIILR
ncbi:MAG: DNA-3-methyladenine glycosylase I [Alistipes sp.]|nr:DNA-3-methyladenine glycosylase I [Alistipes sp.]